MAEQQNLFNMFASLTPEQQQQQLQQLQAMGPPQTPTNIPQQQQQQQPQPQPDNQNLQQQQQPPQHQYMQHQLPTPTSSTANFIPPLPPMSAATAAPPPLPPPQAYNNQFMLPTLAATPTTININKVSSLISSCKSSNDDDTFHLGKELKVSAAAESVCTDALKADFAEFMEMNIRDGDSLDFLFNHFNDKLMFNDVELTALIINRYVSKYSALIQRNGGIMNFLVIMIYGMIQNPTELRKLFGTPTRTLAIKAQTLKGINLPKKRKRTVDASLSDLLKKKKKSDHVSTNVNGGTASTSSGSGGSSSSNSNKGNEDPYANMSKDTILELALTEHPLYKSNLYKKIECFDSLLNIGKLSNLCIPIDFAVMKMTLRYGTVRKYEKGSSKYELVDGIVATFSTNILAKLTRRCVKTYVYNDLDITENFVEFIARGAPKLRLVSAQFSVSSANNCILMEKLNQENNHIMNYTEMDYFCVFSNFDIFLDENGNGTGRGRTFGHNLLCFRRSTLESIERTPLQYSSKAEEELYKYYLIYPFNVKTGAEWEYEDDTDDDDGTDEDNNDDDGKDIPEQQQQQQQVKSKKSTTPEAAAAVAVAAPVPTKIAKKVKEAPPPPPDNDDSSDDEVDSH